MVPEPSTTRKVWSAWGSWAAGGREPEDRDLHSKFERPSPHSGGVRPAAPCSSQTSVQPEEWGSRSGTEGSARGPARGLEDREELVLRAVAVGPPCVQELSGILWGRTGSLFHGDSSRVPAAAAEVAESPFVLPGPPSHRFFLPLSVSGFC